MSTTPFRDFAGPDYQKWIFETLRKELTKIDKKLAEKSVKKITNCCDSKKIPLLL
jgi:hypothetical protein